ncbi:MAG: glycosyltransferase [Bacteroidia bacterium]|nr:glycosyltransferase [Bacteroidia bacterium]
MEASLIISVYTDTISLKAVLDSLKNQSWNNFEIVISEDGESTVMKEFIATYPFKHSWQHLTQEDLGWRKNRALNRAILASNTDYLVFIDGDCVLHPRFMEMHHRFSNGNRILAGKRIKLNDALTEDLLLEKRSSADIQHYVLPTSSTIYSNIFSNFEKWAFAFRKKVCSSIPTNSLASSLVFVK